MPDVQTGKCKGSYDGSGLRSDSRGGDLRLAYFRGSRDARLRMTRPKAIAGRVMAMYAMAEAGSNGETG